MYLNKTNLEHLIENFSGPKNILRSLCNEEKENTCKEIKKADKELKKTKQNLIKEAKKIFHYNTSNLKSPTSDFKYKLELMNNDDPDYNVLKRSFGIDSKTDSFKGTVLNEYSSLKNKNISFKIYRVKANDIVIEKSKSSDLSSLLLLHGTKGPSVKGILKKGFRPSKSGSKGPGVYLTNSFILARIHGNCFVNDEGVPKKLTYLFVNKVSSSSSKTTTSPKDTKSNKQKSSKFSFAKPKSSAMYYNGKKWKDPSPIRSSTLITQCKYYTENAPFFQMFEGLDETPTSFKSSPHDTFDNDKNKILEGTFHFTFGKEKIAVAHHDLVTPAYLVEFEVKEDTVEIVENILYSQLCVPRFINKLNSVITPKHQLKTSKNSSSLTTTNNYSSEMFYAELEVEINSNLQAQVELIKYRYDNKISSLKQQLSFKMSSLFQTDYNNLTQYKTEFLETSDKDYQFILRSVTDDSCNKNPNVLHMFRINPTDENQENKLLNTKLYLHGTKANKITEVLKSGYPKYPKEKEFLREQCNDKCFSADFTKSVCTCKSISNDLEWQLSKGTSYCKVEDEVKKMSFVFVVGGEKEKPYCFKTRRLSTPQISDSRGCTVSYGSFRNPKFDSCRRFHGMVPAYLIVLNL